MQKVYVQNALSYEHNSDQSLQFLYQLTDRPPASLPVRGGGNTIYYLVLSASLYFPEVDSRLTPRLSCTTKSQSTQPE